MSGYLYFQSSGVAEVDHILSALESAGTMFHHTEQWGESCGALVRGGHRGESPLEWIQNAANDAARVVAELRTEVQRLRDALAEGNA